MGILALAGVGAASLEWLAVEYTARGTAWALASRIVVPAIIILAISSRGADERWPVGEYAGAYRLGAVIPMVILMGLWSLHVNFSHGGGSDPLPYLPLLNALDLAHLFAGGAIASWLMALRRNELEVPRAMRGQSAIVIGGAIVFFWLNAALLRTIHHWADVPYGFGPMMQSVLAQAALSVFWAFLALAAMIYATRSGRRAIWMTGAALMGVVVVKLVLVDLEHLSGIERIVSFIGVGVLMLVIGYFSPVPPRKTEEVAA